MLDQQLQSYSCRVGKAAANRRDWPPDVSASPGSHLPEVASHKILPAGFGTQTGMSRKSPSMAQEASTRTSRRAVASPPSGFADPVFILALPGSFSSVVCAMLGQHPEMYGLPETN